MMCAPIRRLLLSCVVVAAAVSGRVEADPLSPFSRESRRIEVISRISPSVVCVMPPNGEGGGSGVLISADGYAISNYHVTSGSGNFMKCGLNDGRVYDAVIVGIDPTGDVALIKLLGRDDFPYATPGNSDLVQAGDEVLALGNPFLLASDFTPTVTYGIASGVHRYQYPAGTFLEYTDCIQIDASINPGNSGGPLFDIDGNWIGINGRASFEKRGRINSGAAYAISVRQVLLFVDHLKGGRIADHAAADFTVGTAIDGEVVVNEVADVSEAWRRGLRAGDELLSFAGRSLRSANDFKNILGIFPEGTRVPLTYRNDDGVRSVTVRLRPLHGFQKAPPIPESRRERKPDEPKPGDEAPKQDTDEADEPQVPDEYLALFEERDEFANYHFNRLQQDRVLGPLRAALAPHEAVASSTWEVRLMPEAGDGQAPIELVAGADGTGWQDGRRILLQSADEPDPANEPLEAWGILSAALQWHRLFRNQPDAFTETLYVGSERHLPLDERLDVVMTRHATTAIRWYFRDGQPLPAGLDVNFSAGYDEARVVFDQWTDDGVLPYPQRIGLVDSETEEIRWFRVEEFGLRDGGAK
ncbi:MAG: trypsin-like peptidase domain-containing protein [Planctomycetaceae bacterium]